MHMTGKQSLCGACGLAFTSVSAFDQHRTGPYSARRCLNEEELTALGFTPNARGLLRIPAPEGLFAQHKVAA